MKKRSLVKAEYEDKSRCTLHSGEEHPCFLVTSVTYMKWSSYPGSKSRATVRTSSFKTYVTPLAALKSHLCIVQGDGSPAGCNHLHLELWTLYCQNPRTLVFFLICCIRSQKCPILSQVVVDISFDITSQDLPEKKEVVEELRMEEMCLLMGGLKRKMWN